MVKQYFQGRYFCAYCGEFDSIVRTRGLLKPTIKCPGCKDLSWLQHHCSGMTAKPVFGFTKVDREVKLFGDLDSTNQAGDLRQRAGAGRKRAEACKHCDLDVYSSRGGARCRADQMSKQHRTSYELFHCPHGNGFHVAPTYSFPTAEVVQ